MPEAKPARADVDWQDTSPLAFAIHENDREIMGMVEQALASQRVRLAFQPVVLARDVQRIQFHEALIRVLDPSGHPIPARAFMPAVEAHEIGRKIDCAALALGLRALELYPEIHLSVNMSARSIGYPKWQQVLRHYLGGDSRIGHRLILEISETSAMQLPEIVSSFMGLWRNRGLRFAMDDYGSGHISIPQLKAFAFDILKIDGRFTRNIHADTEHHAVTAALLAVAKQFNRICVAEAVESRADARWLRQLGVEMLQGYAFGAPTVNPAFMAQPNRKSA